jgi:hypothetical protein
MKFVLIVFSLALLLQVVFALNPFPSDSISYHAPIQGISLQNVDREAAYNIDAQLEPLKPYEPHPIPILGRLSSELMVVVQGNDAISKTLLNFSKAEPENLKSVDTPVGNFTVINDTIAWF